MLGRFQGENGKRLRIEALLNQKIVAGNGQLAEVLSERVQLEAVAAGQTIIEQGAGDNDVILIFTGTFNIVVNGRVIGHRVANDHVGEMAAIEPAQLRAASVVCADAAVIARLHEADLAELILPRFFGHSAKRVISNPEVNNEVETIKNRRIAQEIYRVVQRAGTGADRQSGRAQGGAGFGHSRCHVVLVARQASSNRSTV